jgi:hypothetical protein
MPAVAVKAAGQAIGSAFAALLLCHGYGQHYRVL